MKTVIGWAALLAVLTGCGAPMVRAIPGSEAVRIGKSDAPDGYEQIGPISAIDQGDCIWGTRAGTYEQAVQKLQNDAFERGATYVQIMSQSRIGVPGCIAPQFEINATAFRQKR